MMKKQILTVENKPFVVCVKVDKMSAGITSHFWFEITRSWYNKYKNRQNEMCEALIAKAVKASTSVVIGLN